MELQEIVALHKHWIAADSLAQVVTTSIDSPGGMPEQIEKLAQVHSSFTRLSVHYGLLYVVIEGYRELGVSDSAVDALLRKDEFVEALRLFRNATFHYQKQPISEKLLKFLELEGCEAWVSELHSAFRMYFEESLPIKEMVEALTKTSEGSQA